MKRLIIILAIFSSIYHISSQEMDIKTLDNIFNTMSDTIQGQSGRWQITIEDIMFICIADTAHNRMRIISPIADANTLDENQKTLLLLANFHTALDVKYAISDDVLWSAYIHPLRELTVAQVKDAVSQVYYANITFGTTYTSTDLVFPGKEKKEAKQIKKGEFKKKT